MGGTFFDGLMVRCSTRHAYELVAGAASKMSECEWAAAQRYTGDDDAEGEGLVKDHVEPGRYV